MKVITSYVLFSILLYFLHVTSLEYHLGRYSTHLEAKTGHFILPKYDSIVSRYLAYFGEWEEPFQDVMRLLINKSIEWDITQNRNVSYAYFDIGANIGAWAVPMAKYFESLGGHTYAFEPIQETYFYLCANLVINGIVNVTTFNKAVGKGNSMTATPILRPDIIMKQNLGAMSLMIYERNEEKKKLNNNDDYTITSFQAEEELQTMKKLAEQVKNRTQLEGQSDSNNSSSSSSGSMPREGSHLPLTRQVPMVSLDEMMAAKEIPCPTFIKMDTEMYELYIIRGSLQLLEDCKPILFLEMDCRALTKSVVLSLYAMGYALAWTVLPILYMDDRTFEGRSWKNLTYPLLKDIIRTSPASLTALYGKKSELFFHSELRHAFYPIAVIPHGAIYLEDYEVKACLPHTGECILMKQDITGNQCAGVEMLYEDIHFADHIENTFSEMYPEFAARMIEDQLKISNSQKPSTAATAPTAAAAAATTATAPTAAAAATTATAPTAAAAATTAAAAGTTSGDKIENVDDTNQEQSVKDRIVYL